MKYQITEDVLENSPVVEISKDLFESLRIARNTLSQALYLEEKYELLLKSYFEWEQTIAIVNLYNMTYRMSGYEDFFEHRININLKLITLLTVSRLYIKHTQSHLKHLMDGHKEFHRKILATQYDNNIDYRFMDALRNYMQHREIPLHWITYSRKLKERDKNEFIEFSVQLKTDKKKLDEDGEFKKSVLNEIPENINLNKAASSFIESLSVVHEQIRDMTENEVNKARSLILDQHQNYRSVCDAGSLTALTAFEIDGAERVLNKIPLLLKWDDIREILKIRNGPLTNLKKRITTRVPTSVDL